MVSIRRIRRVLSLVPLALLGACCCGVSESSGALTGDWTYDLAGARADGDPVACSFTGIAVRLAHSGSRLTGSTGGGAGQCTRDDGTPMSAVPLQATWVDGTVDGARVVLDFGGFVRSEGTLAADSITGTAVFDGRAQGPFTLRRRR